VNQWEGNVVRVECCAVIWVAKRKESIMGRDSGFSH